MKRISQLGLALHDPIPLEPNQIRRFYRGIGALAEFRGLAPADTEGGPEDWLGSATRVWTPPGQPSSSLGLSVVQVGDERLTLEEVLQREPAALVGEAVLEAAGHALGVLVKLLDAGERLPVHCHPRRSDAAELLGSFFGKTEAWLILETRETTGRVWAGFREPVADGHLHRWIDEQDVDALLGSLIEYEARPDDVFLIPGGTPHAIDAGVFLLELQEPTDFSVVAETRGFPIHSQDASLGLRWDRALRFFDLRPSPDLRQTARETAAGTTSLLERDADPYFRALRQRVDGRALPPFAPAYAVGIVLKGSGEIDGATKSLELRRGTTFALPAAAVGEARLRGNGLDLAWCLGPEPHALARS